MLEILAKNGHSLDLLIEDFSANSISGRIRAATGLDQRAIDTAAIASHLNSYVNNMPPARALSHRVLARVPLAGRLVARMLDGLGILQSVLVPEPLTRYPIDASKADFLTRKSSVLRYIQGVQVAKNIYFAAKVAGTVGLQGPSIDASQYDLVIVDTPTNIRVKHDRKRIVQVVHDLIPLTDPTLSGLARNRFASAFPHMTRSYQNYIFVSEFTRDRFAELLPGLPHNYCIFYPRIPAAPMLEVKPERRKYALLIVSDEPRKNVEIALEAAMLFDDDTSLYVIGKVDSLNSAPLLKSNPRIKALGYVSETHKTILIAEASCVVVPALAEGFGLPIAEALIQGTPVACSDIPLLREVAGRQSFECQRRTETRSEQPLTNTPWKHPVRSCWLFSRARSSNLNWQERLAELSCAIIQQRQSAVARLHNGSVRRLSRTPAQPDCYGHIMRTYSNHASRLFAARGTAIQRVFPRFGRSDDEIDDR
jgi:glycosyltransferase involved in cell wall biosynthesis